MKNFERCIVADAPTGRYLRILLLGEAPGKVEEAHGRPFVGPAGKLLDSLLVRAGLPRDGCAVSNVFHIRPKDNEVSQFFTGIETEADQVLKPYKYKGGWLRAEYGVEMQRLMKELKQWKPRAVVAMGAVALWAMTGRDDISACVGQALTVQNHVVVPMFHPAFLLRVHNDFYDLAAIKALSDAKEFGGIV